MELNISISLDNAAFEEPEELKRVFEDIAERATMTSYPYLLDIRDINGNVIGFCELKV